MIERDAFSQEISDLEVVEGLVTQKYSQSEISAKPLLPNMIHRVMKTRPASNDNLARLTESFFVVGGTKAPVVKTRVIPVERTRNGTKSAHYEIQMDLEGVRLGERTLPPPLRGKAITERIPIEQLHQYDSLLKPFIPSHLAVDPHPKQLLKVIKRIPHHLVPKIRYDTTVFPPDQRRAFKDTSYPWSAIGRCKSNMGPFSGTMVGPRHLLTCNHAIDWTPPSGYAADWLTFTPSYFDGNAPFGSTYANYVYWIKKDNNNGIKDGDEGQYDYVVLVLKDRIGDRTGWLGTRRYTDKWDSLAVWWHAGYPADLTSMERPTFQSSFAMDGDDVQDDAHQVIRHKADVFPGQSGGPMFGFWDGDVGPRAVAVQSSQEVSTNRASGGGDLVDLVIRARNDFP